MVKRGLGRGLSALIPYSEEDVLKNEKITDLDIDLICQNEEQPRKNFIDEELEDLMQSIKQHGVIQPIVVRKMQENLYQIVAGERRWRASKSVGLEKIPVVVKELTDVNAMEVAITENVQRVNLNPLEEAEAYNKLIEEYDMSQEELATRVGKSRPVIANSLRLLGLCEKVKDYLRSGKLTSGHGRALVSIENKILQEKLAEQVIAKGLSVREVEALVQKYPKKVQPRVPDKNKSEEIIHVEDSLRVILGTKVELMVGEKKGKIMIEYYSKDELERILELFYTMHQYNNELGN